MEVIVAQHLRFLQKIFAVTFLDHSRQPVWSVVGVSDYAQGTFEIFNSATSLSVMTGAVGNGVDTAIFTVPAGTTEAVSIKRPAIFTVSVATGDNGTYCINLYKRLLA